jgi:NAD(P)-dependent dehydrogenase (short-subunit alcohol dehydrogenase family)/acyl carrier protein
MTTGTDGGFDPASAVVLEYLRNVRQQVAAERDVMLRYLGAEVTPGAVAAFDLPPASASTPVLAVSGHATGVSSAPTSAPASGPAPAEAPARPALSGAELLKAVQAIVSERTGYPIEMLDPDLDLEADLSIDSIKRIEIVGELAERIGLGGLDESAIDDEMVEELASHKSLRGIVEWIEALAAEGGGSAAPAGAPAPSAAPVLDAVPLPPAQRFEVHTEPLGPAVPLGDLHGVRVGVVPGHSELTEAVTVALRERGAEVVDPAPEVDAVVDLATTRPGADARTVFASVGPALLAGARRALAVTVPVHADGAPTGVAGLMRSLARERTDALVRSVAVDAADLEGDVAALADAVVDELLDLDAPAALSWAGGERTTQVVGVGRDLSIHGDLVHGEHALGPDAVVVVTGGARGITARVAEGLARANPCTLVLVGRSPLPEGDEDPRTAIAADRSALRRALLEIGELTKPNEIEAACNRIEAAREMRTTLEVLRSFGATVEYAAVDVRAPEFGALLDDVHARHGRLDGVIHGAGVLDDHFLRDKTLPGFDRVFGTKVDGAIAILDRLHLGLRFVVLFGSVSGVFGNRGQTDYAAANDALDALARAYDGHHGCRVLSIDWGPWAGGGMVSPELEREYARRGVGLVDPDDGVMALLHELAVDGGPSQLLVMRGAPEAFGPPLDHGATGDLVGRPTTTD